MNTPYIDVTTHTALLDNSQQHQSPCLPEKGGNKFLLDTAPAQRKRLMQFIFLLTRFDPPITAHAHFAKYQPAESPMSLLVNIRRSYVLELQNLWKKTEQVILIFNDGCQNRIVVPLSLLYS